MVGVFQPESIDFLTQDIAVKGNGIGMWHLICAQQRTIIGPDARDQAIVVGSPDAVTVVGDAKISATW